MNLGLSKNISFKFPELSLKFRWIRQKQQYLGAELVYIPPWGWAESSTEILTQAIAFPFIHSYYNPVSASGYLSFSTLPGRTNYPFFWSNIDPHSPPEMAKIKKGRCFSDKLKPSDYAYMSKPYIIPLFREKHSNFLQCWHLFKYKAV